MKEFVINIFFCTIGAWLVAFALQCFLVPNQLIDGGIVGISIMVSYLTKFDLGPVFLVLSLPFMLLAYSEFGLKFLISALYSVVMVSLGVDFISNYYGALTNDHLLIAIFGGAILGLGVGLVLKNNACMDGTEILSMKLAKKIPYSIGEIIMFFNVFIFCSAGFLYGWEKAMYSTITYLVAYRVIDTVIQGLSEEKSIRIISDKGEEIGNAIIQKMDKTVTYLKAQGGYSKAVKTMVYCIVPRIELYKLKELIISIDKDAFISIENVHEVYGKRYKTA